ncbi:DNA-binding protein P3A2 isoform X3 [Cryptotermes secundus]|uniref:DNA-binding protein P3A2 isoform X3 n=1 Tax=Cryptotermes secundus TaxID=105785 RepID=UPI000CD7D4D2|nr:DNA-binding protein P3A2 isoform X3 [Cryptotermes secundus]
MVTIMNTSGGDSLAIAVGTSSSSINHMVSDDDDGCPSSPGSAQFDDGGDLMAAAMGDEVTAQLAAAGPVGVAAAAAIVSAKKRKRPHSFETNPSIRKRQQNRLLRKLRQTIDEFATRVGQQAVVVVATPGKLQNSFKVFGAKPLEDVVKNIRSVIMEELENALAQQAPPPVQDDPSLYELPPLIIDGIPTPVEKMTQAQLRAFIPLMLKYSTGRGKPGWGRESTRPPWWPKELPWANVRMDARSEEEKQKCRNLQISWTHALRQIVINCYKYHGREDLLPAFSEEDEKANAAAAANAGVTGGSGGTGTAGGGSGGGGSSGSGSGCSNSTVGTVLKLHSHKLQTVTHGPGAGGSGGAGGSIATAQLSTTSPITATTAQVTAQYAPTVLQTISNPDGTVSIIQVDPSNPIITLPDGTTAQVQGVATIHTSQGADGTPTVHAVQALAEVATAQSDGLAVDLNNVTEATLNQDGQLILTGEDGHGYPVSVSGMITVPVSASMYQTVVANLQQIHTQGDGSIQGEDRLFQVVTPMVQVPKVEPTNGSETVDTITVTPQLMGATHQVVAMSNEPQVLQVLSLKDAVLAKPIVTSAGEVKEEVAAVSSDQ